MSEVHLYTQYKTVLTIKKNYCNFKTKKAITQAQCLHYSFFLNLTGNGLVHWNSVCFVN